MKYILMNMPTSMTFRSSEEFAAHLQKLRIDRMKTKKLHREKMIRKSPNSAMKEEILARTGGVCHICGGEIEGNWHANHVSPHSRGGEHSLTNFLPAHQTCNSSRKGFDPEEMQWILKLGVWLKTQIETGSPADQKAVEAFCAYDKKRASRRV